MRTHFNVSRHAQPLPGARLAWKLRTRLNAMILKREKLKTAPLFKRAIGTVAIDRAEIRGARAWAGNTNSRTKTKTACIG